jgi:hypothetical protein
MAGRSPRNFFGAPNLASEFLSAGVEHLVWRRGNAIENVMNAKNLDQHVDRVFGRSHPRIRRWWELLRLGIDLSICAKSRKSNDQDEDNSDL